MSRALELDTNEQHSSESDPPAVTKVFRVTVPKTETQRFGELQEGMASLVELPYRDARKQAIAAFERSYVSALLERCGGNVSHCARTAGVDRVYLHRLLRRYDLRGSRRRTRRAQSEQAAKIDD